jgi:hypothetical protein
MGDLAGDSTLGTYTPVQVFAGEAPIVTYNRKTAAGVTLVKYEVYAVNAAGDAIKYDSAGSAPANVAVGIAAQAAAAASNFPTYEAGAFNHAALVWPVAADTFAERRAAFARTPINIMKLV